MKITVALHALLSCALLFGSPGIEEAQKYRNHSGLQWDWAMEALDLLPDREPLRLLDLGCGDGKITAHLSQRAIATVGVDLSPAMIALATRSFPPEDHPNLLFMEGDLRCIPFCEQFDLATSFCALHWVCDQAAALKGIARSLRPGGYALIVLPGYSPQGVSIGAEALARQSKWAEHFSNFTPKRFYPTQEEFAKSLCDARLLIVDLRAETCETRYPSREAFVDWLRPLVTFADHLPEDLREEYVGDLADYILSAGPEGAPNQTAIHLLKITALAVKPAEPCPRGFADATISCTQGQ